MTALWMIHPLARVGDRIERHLLMTSQLIAMNSYVRDMTQWASYLFWPIVCNADLPCQLHHKLKCGIVSLFLFKVLRFIDWISLWRISVQGMGTILIGRLCWGITRGGQGE